ncbi:SDR family NAD(P)-dependent oxidoreductase [Actinomadura litoris]|uniref:SDR family NAD(P)-dependent oxidoreductase n=1 Tax=Actinomadura litoris TaxID=2678616 RepID=A0A7K1L241_9ACTN|nr:SDR family NAD(P)-dependent oxidoreductase [Actinomadura litoris]MUN38500.1 SDR family NAD(P)-dependent oxidoreductase [Actinomadura litoris]
MIVLVTGANKGIGRAVAEEFAARGHTVLVGSRDPERGSRTVDELRMPGRDVRLVVLDVTDGKSAREAARSIGTDVGGLDVLVNNAGMTGDLTRQAPAEADLDVVRQVFETNVFGVIAVTNAMLPLLRRSPAPRIVNMSSSVGSLSRMSDPAHYLAEMPGYAAYPTSKTALNSLTVQYAKDLRHEGILVNAADPGACDTDLTRPLGRPILRTAADGAAIVVELASLGPDGPTGGLFNDDGPVPW